MNTKALPSLKSNRPQLSAFFKNAATWALRIAAGIFAWLLVMAVWWGGYFLGFTM